MKILHVFLNHGGNTEVWSFNLLKALSRNKVENYIASVNFEETDHTDTSFRYLKYSLHLFGKNKFTRVLNHFFYKKWLLKNINKGEYDVLHAHFGKTAWYYLDILNKSNIPMVVSFYGKDYECIPYIKPIWKDRYKELFKLCSKFICEGSNGINTLSKMGCPQEKCEVVHLGIIPGEIPFHKRNKQVGELKLLQMASFVEKKGHIYAVRAFDKALQTCPNMSMTLVGGKYDAYQEVVDYISKNGLEDKIEILNFVDYSKLYDFFKSFQVFIHPSIYAKDMDCEGGAPVVLLDAQATGMPVISSLHCDIPEEVINGKTGLLADEKDINTLSEHIRKFYNMAQNEYDRFSTHAQEHVLENYDIDKSVLDLISVYKKLIVS